MLAPLEPNRIHTLPVQVQYHLPASSETFTTILPTAQQVYVYPAAPGASDKGDNESWGSIYLKTVVQGVIMSSPEYHPGNDTPDLSLYIFDPRETYLRKSRSSQHPPHFRRSNPPTSSSSSPLLMPSPDLSGPSSFSNSQPQQQEVWTGKGLVSWALNEPGVGKNLVTGKLVRRREYSHITKSDSLSPLEALMAGAGAGQGEESWGIEVSLGLKHGAGGQIGFRPQVQHAHTTASIISRPTSPRPRLVSSSSTQAPAPQSVVSARHSYPAVPRRPGMPPVQSRVPTPNVLTPAVPRRAASSTPARPPAPVPRSTKATSSKARPTPPPRQLATVDTNSRRIASSSKAASSSATTRDLPFEIPRHVYDNPDLLTKEQAERLIASPFFLDKLSEMTGHPLVPKVKREREEDGSAGSNGHSAKKSRKSDGEGEQTKCYNCGRVKSYVWRQLALDDNNTVTICNACGIYRNRHGHMRPPSMWEGVEDDVKTLRLGANLPAMPSSEIDLPAPRLDSGFKRTLSAVVEKDAERIAGMRKPPFPNAANRPSHMSKSTLPASRQMPMTSPPRGSGSAVMGVRNTSRIVDTQPAASSPGGYAIPRSDAQTHSRAGAQAQTHIPVRGGQQSQEIRFDPNESPNTAINRILGTSMNMPMQSLEMPLSDDGHGRHDTPAAHPWGGNGNTDMSMSSFFDVENLDIQMSAGPHGATALKSPSPPPSFHRTSSSSVASRRKAQAYAHGQAQRHHQSGGTEEDDVLSQLFNRTSSIGPLGSSPASAPGPQTAGGYAFDFSQLPPSSPPASAGPSSDMGLDMDLELELGHSALLLSSPDIDVNSPPSQKQGGRRMRVSPEKPKSNLNKSFTPQDIKQEPVSAPVPQGLEQVPSKEGEPPAYQYDFDDLWAKLQFDGSGTGGMASSGEMAEGLLGSGSGSGQNQSADDFLALFNSLTNSQ